MLILADCSQGNDIQLTCMTPNMRNSGIGFGWTKNRALLKLELGRAVWEDLYPAGSILKITNTQVLRTEFFPSIKVTPRIKKYRGELGSRCDSLFNANWSVWHFRNRRFTPAT